MKKIILLLSISLGITACTTISELNKRPEPIISRISTVQMCNDIKKNPLNDKKYIGQYITFSGKVSVTKSKHNTTTKNEARLIVTNKNNYFNIDNYPDLSELINGNQIKITGKIKSIDLNNYNDKSCSFLIDYYK